MFNLGETMSSPTKQVSVRRLPPLPNQITLRNFRENGNVNDETHAGGGSLKGKPSGGKKLGEVFTKCRDCNKLWIVIIRSSIFSPTSRFEDGEVCFIWTISALFVPHENYHAWIRQAYMFSMTGLKIFVSAWHCEIDFSPAIKSLMAVVNDRLNAQVARVMEIISSSFNWISYCDSPRRTQSPWQNYVPFP